MSATSLGHTPSAAAKRVEGRRANRVAIPAYIPRYPRRTLCIVRLDDRQFSYRPRLMTRGTQRAVRSRHAISIEEDARLPGCMVSESLADEAREKFWRRVAEFEEGPFTTNFEQLTNAGVELPAPETLNDAALTTKLWEVIGRLARVSVFISHTNHLSDRELYTRLWSDWLREEIPESSDDDDGV